MGWGLHGIWMGVLACSGLAACGLLSGASDLEPNLTADASSSSSSGSTSSSASSSSSSSGTTTSSSSSGTALDGAPNDAAIDVGADTSTTPAAITECGADSLIAYWKMNDGAGNTAADCGPSKLNGTLNTNLSWAAGRNGPNRAIELSGAAGAGANLLSLGAAGAASASLKTTGALTVSTWVFITDQTGSIIGRATTADTVSWALFYTPTDVLHATMKDVPGNGVNFDLTTTISKNAWKLLTIVFRPGAAYELWIGAVKVAEKIAGVPNATPNFGNVRIGRIDDPADAFGHFNGRLQQLRMFAKALSSAEIAQLAAEP